MSFEQRLEKPPITSFGFFSLWSKEGPRGAWWPVHTKQPQLTVDGVVSNLWDMCWEVRAKTPGEASDSLTRCGVVWSILGGHVESVLTGGLVHG